MNSPDLVHMLLTQSTDKYPDHPVLINKDQITKYSDLELKSSNFAYGLNQIGVRKGDHVALVLDNTIDYLIAYYGILKAGAVVIPLCPDTRQRILAYSLGHSEAKGVILTKSNCKYLDGQSDNLPKLEYLISLGKPQLEKSGKFKIYDYQDLIKSNQEYTDSSIHNNDLAAIVYTSGTTGAPKGVMLEHRNLTTNITSIVKYLELTHNDIIAMVLPFFYVYGNSVLQTHISVGGTIAMVGSMTFPPVVLKGIQEHKCTGFSGVPSTFARLIKFSALDKFDLSSLRYLTQAGGPMTASLTQKLTEAIPNAKIFVMYGQTEASARLSYLPPKDLPRKLGSCGIAIPGVTLEVVDESGTLLGPNTNGEIVAKGGNIMRGYYNNKEETQKVLQPYGLKTGDLGYKDEDGYLYIVARKTDMIKSGAHRISPNEIEDVIEKIPEIAQAAVTGVPDDLLGEAIAAFVVTIDNTQISKNTILKFCNENLPRFKMPAHIHIVESLPRSPSGKLRRNELKNWFAEKIAKEKREKSA